MIYICVLYDNPTPRFLDMVKYTRNSISRININKFRGTILTFENDMDATIFKLRFPDLKIITIESI